MSRSVIAAAIVLLGMCAAGLVAMPVAWKANGPVRARATGADLVPALGLAGFAMLAWSVLVSCGFVISTL